MICDELDRLVQKQKQHSKVVCIDAADTLWSEFFAEKSQKCGDNISRVMNAVVEAEGGYFDEKYTCRVFKHQELY